MLSLICNFEWNETNDRFSQVGSYKNLIENRHTENICGNDFYWKYIEHLKDVCFSGTKLEIEETHEKIKSFIGEYISSNRAHLDEVISLAISCLHGFVQANWLGPDPIYKTNQPLYLVIDKLKEKTPSNRIFCLVDYFDPANKDYETLQDQVRGMLSLNGESLFPIVKCSHLLLIAKSIFLDFEHEFKDVSYFNWWSLRTIFLYQQLFEEKSADLTDLSIKFMDKLSPLFDDSNENSLNKKLDHSTYSAASVCYFLESGHIHYQNYNWTLGQASFRKALNISNLTFELTGVYGKRTKYQQKDLAQLLLKVVKQDGNEQQKVNKSNDFSQWPHFNKEMDENLLPKDLALNDDVLLDKMKISNPNDEKLIETGKVLSQLEQVVLFSSLFDFQKNNAQHILTNEEMSPFIDHILAHPKNWCVQISTLLLRTKLEMSSVRRMERSLLQLETLVDHYRQHNGPPEYRYRTQFFFPTWFLSFWALQKELCKFYMQLGLINTSLEVYLSLQMWDDVIKCYHTLDKNDKAEEIIRQQLKLKETPDLYCSLGEVTKDVQYFEKAIELSKQKSARAYRMLAKYQFSKEQYAEAIVNFERSLSLNSMQYDAWFMLGSAGFRSEKWETAIKAFRYCTTLDPENHETWNNLAASYIKLNDKDKAHYVFQEALKNDYENWKVWENFLWTSIDCGYFEDTIKAYNRLLDLKDKYLDVDVLKALKISVEKNLKDAYNVPVIKLKQKILKLFARVTSAIPLNWQAYWYYAEIVLKYGTTDESNEQIKPTDEKISEFFYLMIKSLRNLYNQPNWESSVPMCKEVLDYSTYLLDYCLEYGGYLTKPQDQLGSISLSIRLIINKLKQKYEIDSQNSGPFIKLIYLKDLDQEFYEIQARYDTFIKKYFS